LRYDAQGRLRADAVHHATASDADLPGYLEQARRLLAARTPDGDGDGDGSLPGLSADFEALRWFVLPPECLAGVEPPARPAGADGLATGIGSAVTGSRRQR
jgi:hypothetical protein